ncbi:MAG TPA: hypothetical protein VGH65_09500 [Verrucomicrobiaceae bacterium]
MNPSDFTSPETFEMDPGEMQNPDPIQDAVQSAREKLDDAVHAAREKMESAGSATLKWVRENPATALAGIFASGLAVGFALARNSREPTFQERLSEEPVRAIREAVYSALAPIGARLHNTLDSARSAAGKAADRFQEEATSGAWGDKVRRLGGNLKFW